jgi:hypothetical protein
MSAAAPLSAGATGIVAGVDALARDESKGVDTFTIDLDA